MLEKVRYPPLLIDRRAAVTGHHNLTRPDPLGFCLVMLATRYKTTYQWLHSGYMDTKQKAPLVQSEAKCLYSLGWLMGLEPTTTGITILDSTN